MAIRDPLRPRLPSLIRYAPYELIARRPLNARAKETRRRGALIRVDDGFADVHPWPELGDAPLEEQLAMLAQGELTPLTRAALGFAAIDAAARREGRWLFEDVTVPLSHWSGAEPPAAFDTVKIKCGPGFDPATLPAGVRLRLDFNATLTPSQFAGIASRLPVDRIDFVEDPTPYDAETWRALQASTGLRLALDRAVADDGVDVVVCKPAVQEVPRTRRELVVTSYMDHPLGQVAAAYVAARAATSDRCGLVTHVLYEPTAFTEALALDGARLAPSRGTGFGFDALLEAMPWRTLQ